MKSNHNYESAWWGTEECSFCGSRYHHTLEVCPNCKRPNETKLEDLKKKYINEPEEKES